MTLLHFFSTDWGNLHWSPPVPFIATKEELRQIPNEPGLYRISPINQNFLMYIGETGRALRKRIGELRRHSLAEEFPWNDPHTAAQSLWAWRKDEGYSYECSAASLKVSKNDRIGWESFLLAKYRREYGESTLCNFGRFHKRYRKSTGRKLKNGKLGRKGGQLDSNAIDNPAGGASIPPLRVVGKPGELNWMGLEWIAGKNLEAENIRHVPKGPGLYILLDSSSQEIIYIGEGNCKHRLQSHRKKSWGGKKLGFMYCMMEKTILPHQLKELENDLIGNYFEQYRRAPEYQFRNKQ